MKKFIHNYQHCRFNVHAAVPYIDDPYFRVSSPIVYLEELPNGQHVESYNAIEDLLGCYNSGNMQRHVAPYIQIFVNRIADIVKDQEEFNLLFTKVLIHEEMHARMDVSELNGRNKSAFDCHNEACRWREEACANALTLLFIEKRGDENLFSYAKNFMLNNQPDEYKLGVYLYEQLQKQYGNYFGSIMDHYVRLKKSLTDVKYVEFWKENMESYLQHRRPEVMEFFEQTYFAGNGFYIYNKLFYAHTTGNIFDAIKDQSHWIDLGFRDDKTQLPREAICYECNYANAEATLQLDLWFYENCGIYDQLNYVKAHNLL